MKMFSKFLTALVIVLAVSLAGCTVIEPGYGGIVVNKLGDKRGVDDLPVKTGLVGYNPLSTDVYNVQAALHLDEERGRGLTKRREHYVQ